MAVVVRLLSLVVLELTGAVKQKMWRYDIKAALVLKVTKRLLISVETHFQVYSGHPLLLSVQLLLSVLLIHHPSPEYDIY